MASSSIMLHFGGGGGAVRCFEEDDTGVAPGCKRPRGLQQWPVSQAQVTGCETKHTSSKGASSSTDAIKIGCHAEPLLKRPRLSGGAEQPADEREDRGGSAESKEHMTPSSFEQTLTPRSGATATRRALASASDVTCENPRQARIGVVAKTASLDHVSSRPPKRLPKGPKRYQRHQKIGEGVYGKVYKAFDIVTSRYVALKSMPLYESGLGLPSIPLREVALLTDLKQLPNVVNLLDIFTSKTRLWMVFELLTCDLYEHMGGQVAFGPLPMPNVKHFLFDLLTGLQACHAHRIVHRDIKPQNLLIDAEKNELKIGDFGMSRSQSPLAEMHSPKLVTLWYRAPEILLGSSSYSTAVDIWSAGCVLAEMAAGRPLFDQTTEIGIIMGVFQTMGTPTEETWPGVSKLPDYKFTFPQFPGIPLELAVPQLDSDGLDLLQSMLAWDPATRITASQALQHPFLSELSSQER